MYLVTDVVMDERPTVQRSAETGNIRIVFGLNGHLSLAPDEAAHLAAELGAHLGYDEIHTLIDQLKAAARALVAEGED